MKAKPDCYGKIYPDLARHRYNELRKGKVFDVFVESSGLGITDRRFKAKMDEWNRCTECPEYQHCFNLSLAKLLLGGVLENEGTAPAV